MGGGNYEVGRWEDGGMGEWGNATNTPKPQNPRAKISILVQWNRLRDSRR